MTIPVEFLRELGIAEGDAVTFERAGDALVVRRADIRDDGTYDSLARYRKSPRPTLQEEKEAFAQAIVEDYLESESRSS